MHDLLMIDGLQYSNWSQDIFQQKIGRAHV